MYEPVVAILTVHKCPCTRHGLKPFDLVLEFQLNRRMHKCNSAYRQKTTFLNPKLDQIWQKIAKFLPSFVPKMPKCVWAFSLLYNWLNQFTSIYVQSIPLNSTSVKFVPPVNRVTCSRTEHKNSINSLHLLGSIMSWTDVTRLSGFYCTSKSAWKCFKP